MQLNPSLFKDKTILVTGHTGFKGAWLSLWLNQMGAHVIGFSLEETSKPSLFTLLDLSHHIVDVRGDIRDQRFLAETFDTYAPEIVIHLAAQSLVLPSYQNPKETFETNFNGTLNLLEEIRKNQSVQAALIITSDKCYHNHEWTWGYRENDRLGGDDPYSCSKAVAELLVNSYQLSFFPQGIHPCIATARAGNVIGGGDFSEHRIVPDIISSLINHEPVHVRNPQSVRPWNYVLDTLFGYLLLVDKMLTEPQGIAGAWNFGPRERGGISVRQLVKKVLQEWGEGAFLEKQDLPKKEKKNLQLNWDKAANHLGWQPACDWEAAVTETVLWYKGFSQGDHPHTLSVESIQRYLVKRETVDQSISQELAIKS